LRIAIVGISIVGWIVVVDCCVIIVDQNSFSATFPVAFPVSAEVFFDAFPVSAEVLSDALPVACPLSLKVLSDGCEEGLKVCVCGVG
jgi:hypothetical protein